jgi:prepilin-type N-terminal cleavage/methylation domain-containing protein
MRNTNKAFTLVELIVVITILAILGTIAFISLQGYTGEAKNSKVTSDLRNIASAIETASTRNSVVLRDVMTNQMSSYNVDTTDTF